MVDASHGQAGIGKNPAGGQPHGTVLRGQIALGFPHGLFGLSAEVVVLRQSDVLFGTWPHILDGLHAVSWLKGCIHQGHKVGKQLLLLRLFMYNQLFFPSARVLRFFGIFWDCPGAAELFCTGDTSLCAVLVDPALGYAPFFRSFSN